MSQLKTEGKHEASWITISTDEFESMKATIEALSDPEVMEQFKNSEERVYCIIKITVPIHVNKNIRAAHIDLIYKTIKLECG